jgi:hypothetical protein
MFVTIFFFQKVENIRDGGGARGGETTAVADEFPLLLVVYVN